MFYNFSVIKDIIQIDFPKYQNDISSRNLVYVSDLFEDVLEEGLFIANSLNIDIAIQIISGDALTKFNEALELIIYFNEHIKTVSNEAEMSYNDYTTILLSLKIHFGYIKSILRLD